MFFVISDLNRFCRFGANFVAKLSKMDASSIWRWLYLSRKRSNSAQAL